MGDFSRHFNADATTLSKKVLSSGVPVQDITPEYARLRQACRVKAGDVALVKVLSIVVESAECLLKVTNIRRAFRLKGV